MSKIENNLNLTVVPSDFLEKMEADLQEVKNFLRVRNEKEANSQWIESVKVPEILGISRKTWQNYRDKRLIPFSQVGAKIYVKRADLEAFMMEHRIEAQY